MTVTVKKIRISADWVYPTKGGLGKPTKFLTQYVILQDGKRIDSFMSKEAAERKAAELNRTFATAGTA